MTNIAKHYWKGMVSSEETKTVNSVGVKPEEIGQEEDEEMLEGTEHARFRSLTVTLNYMSLDRSDVQYAAKKMCTKIENPTRGGWKRLKKACRHLRGVENVTWVMRALKHDGLTVNVHVDSGYGKQAQKEVDEWMLVNRHSGETSDRERRLHVR